MSELKTYCPKDEKDVPIWYCLGSVMQGRETCKHMESVSITYGKAVSKKCNWKEAEKK